MRDPYGTGEFDLFALQDRHTRRQARLLVASHAESAEDCRALLRALDLIDATHAGATRQCPRCGTAHERWGSSARHRFCSESCAAAPLDPDGVKVTGTTAVVSLTSAPTAHAVAPGVD